MSEPTSTKLEPTLTSLRKLAENHLSFGQYKAAQILLEAIDAIEQLEAENAKLRELVTELHSLATYEYVYVEYENESWERRLDAAEDSMRELGVEL